MSLQTQTILIIIIIAGAIGWIIYKLLRSRKDGGVSSCCGCALSETCAKKPLKVDKDTCCDDRKEICEESPNIGDNESKK